MKLGLQLKFSQHLALTPQLQQSIRLLQLSSLELEEEIKKAVEENPLLELLDEVPPDEAITPPSPLASTTSTLAADEPYSPEGSDENIGPGIDESQFDNPREDWESYSAKSQNDLDDDPFTTQQAAPVSLSEHLLQQLALTSANLRDRVIITYLIDALSEDGYLDATLEEICATISSAEFPTTLEEVSCALLQLQRFDPTGVGARSTSECLSLQLLALPETTPYRALALETVQTHLPLLAARDFSKLRRNLKCDEHELHDIHALIQTLTPRPGAAFNTTETRYIVPDVIVRKWRGRWQASLNEAVVPKIAVNQSYANIVSKNREAGALAGQLTEAKWLVRNVRQRFDTITRVAQAIVARQADFFEHGELAMKPLVLREIAEELELHESTISRVTTHKYLMSPRGIFEFKHFFGSSLGTESGGSCSSTAIRALIKQIILEENPKKPLTDTRITQLLSEKGVVVARRTVAKYREGMSIPAVNLRKSF